MRLGFSAGRRGAGTSLALGKGQWDGASPERLADRLRPLAGRWVAIRDEDILHAADSPHELVGWLGRQGQSADSVFRVPDDELAANGLAPL
ncbi:MAG: hypothetical protein MSC31_08365 [Solirubrobacteraceae bacterium MAG38_C4-C5]|nr:hypothetical protein [Candidatus Siliceabacter maunaloa]